MKRFLIHSTVLGLCCALVFLFVLPPGDADPDSVHIHVAENSVLQVAAHWQPDANSWLKLYKNSQYTGLFNLKPAHSIKEYGAAAFNAFLPTSSGSLDARGIAVGDVWAYEVRDVLPFLRQFHPGATVDLSGQRGAFACLRALSPRYAEIVFRFHADFHMKTETEELMKMTAELSSGQLESIELEESVFLEHLKMELAEAEARREKMDADIKALGEQSQKLSDTLLQLDKADAIPAAQNSEFTELKREILKLSAALAALNMSQKSQSASLSGKLTTLERKFENGFSTLNEKINEKIENEFAKLRTASRRQSGTLTKRLDKLDTQVAKLNRAHAYNTGIYFTPRHFTGRLLINRETGTIQAFSLGVPAHSGNTTLFAFGGVDTVSVPRMELIGKGPIDQGEIAWTTAITAEEAEEKLRSQFLAKRFRLRD